MTPRERRGGRRGPALGPTRPGVTAQGRGTVDTNAVRGHGRGEGVGPPDPGRARHDCSGRADLGEGRPPARQGGSIPSKEPAPWRRRRRPGPPRAALFAGRDRRRGDRSQLTASMPPPVPRRPRPRSARPGSPATWPIHQDVEPDPNKKDKAKPQGNYISGEAVYLDNGARGGSTRGSTIATGASRPRAGPIPWAKVSTDDMTVRGEIIWMDQEHDKIRAYGPGKCEPVDRPRHDDRQVGRAEARRRCRGRRVPWPWPTVRPPRCRPGSEGTCAAMSPPGRRRHRSPVPAPARPIGDKDLLTITWTECMEFNGRTVDTTGRPAGLADFFGRGRAEMTDARLYWNRR